MVQSTEKKEKIEKKENLGVEIDNTEKSIKRKTSFPRKKDEFFSKVGIIGWEKNSTPMIVSLLTGYGCYFIGAPGTGKTFAAKQVANHLLCQSVSVIDGSKADWEELVGPYDAKAYAEGRLEYMKTPQSIWDRVILFIDEANRADTKIQNGMLELMRENLLCGMATAIEYKWAASNPLSDEGTQPLSEALADRFMFVLPIPDLLSMSDKQLAEVAQQGASVDDLVLSKYVPGLKRYKDKYPYLKEEFFEYLCGVGKEWVKVKKALNITGYCIAFAKYYQSNLKKNTNGTAKNNPYTIEQRRMNIMITAATGALAVELHEYNSYINSLPKDKQADKKLSNPEMTSWLHEILFRTMRQMVTIDLTAKELNPTVFDAAHNVALSHIKADGLDTVYRIRSESDYCKRFFRALANADTEPLEIHDAFDNLHSGYVLNEANMFGTKIDPTAKQLNGLDTLIPVFFLVHNGSPLAPLLEKLPIEIIQKFKEMASFGYQFRLLEHPDKDLPEMIWEYSGHKVFDGYDDKLSQEEIYTEEYLALDPFERSLREVIFRRVCADEGQFARIALSMGEETKIKDDPAKVKEQVELRKKVTDELIIPNFKYTVKKVREEYEKIREILIDEGFADLVRPE